MNARHFFAMVVLSLCGVLGSMGEVWKDFSAPTAVHIGYSFPGMGGAREFSLYLVDGSGQRSLIVSGAGGLYGHYRVAMETPPYQVISRYVSDTLTNEVVQLALPQPTEISGRAQYDEEINITASVTSGGFAVAAGVTVTVNDTDLIAWPAASFEGSGTITLNHCKMPGISSAAADLTLTSCLVDGDALIYGTNAVIRDCLLNGSQDNSSIGTRLEPAGSLEMSGCEVVGNFWVRNAGDVALHDNTFYSELDLFAPITGTVVVRNNTVLAGIYRAATTYNIDNNYYGAPGSNRDTTPDWLNPWHLDPVVPSLEAGDIVRCSRLEPRRVPLFRELELAVGHAVLIQQSHTVSHNYYPENFTGRIRMGLPFVMAFDLKSSVDKLPDVTYELVYRGIKYQPVRSYTATARREVDNRKDNADLTLNFILPAPDILETNSWQLFADFSVCNENIVKPSPARVCIADGGIPVQPGFARPLRIGVLEINLADGSAISSCSSTARSRAITRLKNDLLTKLALTDAEVQITDLGYYTFSGGLISSWLSQTDLGRANQLSSELEWFVGDYNATVTEPLDFVVGVAPVLALGGADGLSMALRRHAVLVDEFSPDAALHEIGHSMGLYTDKEQYNYPYGYAYMGGFYSPGRGLELAGISAFNPSGKANAVVPPNTIRHFPGCMHNGVYDVMGAVNPQWISAGVYSTMNQWFTEHLKLATTTKSAPAAVLQPKDSSPPSRIVHLAAIYSRFGDGDHILPASLRVEEIVGARGVYNDGIYNLNYRFQSYDANGNILTATQCTAPAADYLTNAFWMQAFSVPTNATEYRLFHTSAPGDLGTYPVWTWKPATALTNGLNTIYNAGTDAYELTWQHNGTRREVENRLLVSTDAGVSWNPLPLPTYSNHISIPRSGLAQNNPRFKLLSSDGIHSVVSAAALGQPAVALPPVVRILSPLAGAQGSPGVIWQLGAEVSDPNNDLVSVKWFSSRDGLLGHAASLATNLSVGTHQLSAVATDAAGLSATGTVNVVVGNLAAVDLQLTAADIRVAPLVNGVGLNTVGYGQTNTLTVTLHNQGFTNRIRLQVFGTKSGKAEATLYDETLSLAPFDEREVALEFFAPTRGTYSVRVAGTPLDLPDANPTNNEVIVSYTNQPPRVFPNRVSVLADALPLQVPLAAQDPNGDAVTFSLVPATGASLAQNILTFDNGGAAGSYPLQVTASDGDLTSPPATIMVDVYDTVVPAPAPVFTSPTSFTVSAGQPVTLNLTVDNGPCTFAATDLPTGLYLDPASGQITGQMDIAGTYHFSVTAQNSKGTATAAITLQVNAVTVVPGDNLADAVGLAGASLDFTADTTGATHETGEPNHAGALGSSSLWWHWTAPASGVVGIQWSSAFMPAALAVYTGTNFAMLTEAGAKFGFNDITCFPAVAGQQYLIVLDAFGGATFSLNLAYHPEPVLRSPANMVVRQNQPVDFYFQTWNPALYFAASNLPAGLMLESTTGHITGTPTGYGYLVGSLTATNAAGSSTASVYFTVLSVNAPVIISPLYATATRGEAFSYQLQVSHASPGTLYAGPLPLGLQFDGETGLLAGTPLESGGFSIYLNAGNTNTSEYVNETLTLLVRNSYALWLAGCGFTVAEQGNPGITGFAADPDHDGAGNYAEYIAGTNPRDPADVLKLTLRRDAGGWKLQWPGKSNRCYAILQADAVGGPFTVRSNNILATPPANSLSLPMGNHAGFLRVQVQE